MTSAPTPGAGAARDESAPPHDLRECLSAAADGDPAALQRGMALWREDAKARECWHLHHLIGDVLRSEELARPGASGGEFLAGVRARLASEPVPLAPAQLAPAPLAPALAAAGARVRHLGWRAPAAVAAGFAAVAASLVLLRPASELGGGPNVSVAAPPATSAAPPPGPAAPGVLVNDGRVLRDARIDAYLRAHQSVGGVAPTRPGSGLRNVDVLIAPGELERPPSAVPGVPVAAPPGVGGSR